MGRRSHRKKPTRKQKIAMADTRRVSNPNPEGGRIVACGVRKGGGIPVVSVDFAHFRVVGRRSHGDHGNEGSGMHSHGDRGNEGRLPDLENMGEIGRGVVLALADKLGCTPDEIIRRARG